MKKELNIVKVSGKILQDSVLMDEFIRDFAEIKTMKILVHGSGVQIDSLLKNLGIPVEKKDGRRITDIQSLCGTIMVSSVLNNKIVNKLNVYNYRTGKNNFHYIGLPNISVILNSKKINNDEIDFGFVGKINKDFINIEDIIKSMQSNIVPVFSPITFDSNGNMFLNSNADSVASGIALAFSQEYKVKLTFCSDVPGLLKNKEDENSLINKVSENDYLKFKSDGIIVNGMIPKMENAFNAINAGVSSVRITDSLIKSGTEIVR